MFLIFVSYNEGELWYHVFAYVLPV